MKTDPQLTLKLHQAARELGADLLGIAPVSRYEHAPKLLSPQGHWPGATNIIVVALHHTDGVVEMGGREHPQRLGPYAVQNWMNTRNEHIVWQLARLLHAEGWDAMPMPATNIWRFRPYGEINHAFVPDISNIHAAAAAGLGEIGYSGLLLTPEFGPRQRFCTLISNAPLEPTPLYRGPELCDRCLLCARHCMTQAFDKEVSGECEVIIEDKIMRYPDRNMWRCAWGEHFGLDLDLDKPDVITENTIREFLAKYGRRGGEMGSCLRYCLPPHLRHFDPEYTNTVRRRTSTGAAGKPMDRPAAAEALALAFQWGADWAVAFRRETAAHFGIDLRALLTDAESLLVFGMRLPEPVPPECRAPSDAAPAGALRDLGVFAEIDIARALERRGYAAIPRPGIPEQALRRLPGLDSAGECILEAVVSSAPLLEQGRHAAPPDRNQDILRALEEFAGSPAALASGPNPAAARFRQLLPGGIDLVGVTGIERLNRIADQLETQFDREALCTNIVDRGGTHGPVEPAAVRSDRPVPRRPQQILPGARSVVVLGAAVPEITIRRAAEPPADGVGPYAAATYQVRRELRYAALALARALRSRGQHAVVVDDLLGTASSVITPRGRQPDASASRFAAVAAGLGALMHTGSVFAPPFGNRARFIAVVTDAEFRQSPLFTGSSPCAACTAKPCIPACPTRALRPETITFELEGRPFTFGRLDRLRCDWAAKFGLVGAEGPRWIGSATDILPPDRPLRIDDIIENYAKLDPIQKHWMCVIDPCLRRCLLSGRLDRPRAQRP